VSTSRLFPEESGQNQAFAVASTVTSPSIAQKEAQQLEDNLQNDGTSPSDSTGTERASGTAQNTVKEGGSWRPLEFVAESDTGGCQMAPGARRLRGFLI
jgi:hypothetical protein